MIRHQGIEHNIFGDAPFVGARISAIQCTHNCPGCFHEHLKDEVEIIEEPAEDIIQQVLDNPFDEGIILGGLEWTEQHIEMNKLIDRAKRAGLQVILYTHLSQEEYIRLFGEPSGMYIKHGEFRADGKPHKQYGVQLANSEQYIVRYE